MPGTKHTVAQERREMGHQKRGHDWTYAVRERFKMFQVCSSTKERALKVQAEDTAR